MNKKEKYEQQKYIESCVAGYVKFMGINSLPEFDVIEKTVQIDQLKEEGYQTFEHRYDVQTGKHTLVVIENINLQLFSVEPLLYHEFTHILDLEMYGQKEPKATAMCKGFTEYHAGQVDFLKFLGANKANKTVSFSMKQKFNGLLKMESAEEMLLSSHIMAIEQIRRSDFPKNYETLLHTIGFIFLYFGRRSICKMYSTDYKEEVDNTSIQQFMGEQTFKSLDIHLNGWLTENNIQSINKLYFELICSKFKEYGF